MEVAPWLVLVIGVPAYMQAMPSPAECRMADPRDGGNRAMQRSGEIVGSAVLVIVGVTLSVFSGGDRSPVVLAVIAAVLLTMVHELLLWLPGVVR